MDIYNTVPIVIGVMWLKWATPLKLVRQKISGMSKYVAMDQPLQNMCGHSTTA